MDGGDSSVTSKADSSGVSIFDDNSIISEWMLSYLTPILKLGATKVLQVSDVGAISEDDSADLIFSKVSQEWEKEKQRVAFENMRRLVKTRARSSLTTQNNVSLDFKEDCISEAKYKKKSPSLAKVLLKSYGISKFGQAVFYYFLSILTQFVPVLLLNNLVRYFESGSDFRLHFGVSPWVHAILIGFMPFLTSLLQTRHTVIVTHLAVLARTGCATLLYDKSLRISPTGRSKTNTGQVVNMMSSDTSQLQRFLQFSGFVMVAPLQIILSLVLIYNQVGNAMWAGVAYMVILAPVNALMFSSIGKMRREVLKYSDSRIKIMNEVLNGIRIIKFYAWESPFKKEVGKLRRNELKALTKLTYVSNIGFSILMMSAPVVQLILVFLTYTQIQDDEITPSKAFTTVALFNLMRLPFALLPMGILQFIQSKISVKRLSKYLDLPELESYVHTKPPIEGIVPIEKSRVGSVSMHKASFGWNDPSSVPESMDKRKGKSSVDPAIDTDTESTDSKEKKISVLEGISCTIKAGELVAVVGEVGSGKSSFLSAILGEMEPINDAKVYMPGNEKNSHFTSFCNQTPWVVNDTLKGNVIFGRKLDQERYDKVITACALKDDLEILPAGDMTEIGERGINLSGGQKARVCLARAMYSTESKILLLDDPLSAVDSHVGEHLFEEAITGEVSRGTTRILVTHHVHFLPRCDSVIVLEGGKIKHHGSYDELISQGVEFKGMGDDVSDTDQDEIGDIEKEGEEIEVTLEQTKFSTKANSPSKKIKKTDVRTMSNNQMMRKKRAQLILDEDRVKGSVGSASYVQYSRAGGIGRALLILLAQGGNRSLDVGATFWLAYWSSQTVLAMSKGEPFPTEKTTQYVRIYALFGAASLFCLATRGLLLANLRLRASRKLHDDLTSNILRAPVSFFDTTPTGRILNRFAYDIDKIDLALTDSASQALNTASSVLAAIGAMIAATKGVFIIPLIPLTYTYFVIQKWFRKSSTELQRVTSMTGSPIFADFSQTLSGTSTVRAFGMQNNFFSKCKSSFDINNASYMLVQLSAVWLGLRLDIMGGIVATFIAALSVGTAQFNFIPAAWLGLGLTSAIEITGYLKHGVRMMATVEADLTSVERILDYSENIEQEPPEIIPDKDPKEGTWPTKGVINIDSISMRYRDGPLVLKNLSMNVNGGEKIGVVGRTGSGKSSLMIALFRITGIEPDGGNILIDGVNTSDIGTISLRSNLSIIPQDPVLFSNTVRYNLDPFGTAQDEEIWSALRKVRLADFVAGLTNGLMEQVSEGGENFSQGQRQLLCIARSILRRPKILIMDEATASIDNGTDELIQEMIRENFADATVLTIAHRLNTIMDSDRVLVLDNGYVAEFDSPKNLLMDKNGIFYGMVEKSNTNKAIS